VLPAHAEPYRLSVRCGATKLSPMSALPTTAVVPLVTDPHSAVRVRGTRALLDTIVTAFRAGATAEEIAQKFPSLALADVYQVIALYLNHTAEIDEDLAGRQFEAAALQREIEGRLDPAGIRARLLARRDVVSASA
jgi:uncharacterized protein (DUF433 family)